MQWKEIGDQCLERYNHNKNMSQLCSSKMNVTFLRVYFHGTDIVGPLIHCPKQGLDESNMKRIVGRSLKFWSTQS